MLRRVKASRRLTIRELKSLIDAGSDVCRWLNGDALPPLHAVARMEKLFRIYAYHWTTRLEVAA